MSTATDVQRLEGKLGDLLSSREGEVDFSRFEPYRDDPVAFSREVLGDTDPGPWSVQREVMELVAHNDRMAWRSGQGVGKGWTISRIALWWAFARRGLVLLSAPTSRTVHETLMRKEIARAHRRSGLPGDLYVNALRLRDEEASILAYTTSNPSGGTGHHDRAVLAVLDEAQGVDATAWEAMFANITGRDDKLFAAGNPLEPTGPFFEVSRPGSGWQTVQTSCLDHPNLTEEDPSYIRGGPSDEWLERMEDRFGRDTPMWTARVLGEFPADAVEGLYSRKLVDAAIERELPPPENAEPVVAVDPARHGMDRTAVAVRRGRIVEELTTWSGASTTETEKKVERLAREAGVRQRYSDAPFELKKKLREKGKEVPWGTVVVDEIGIGAGVVDGLEDGEWPCRGWKGSRKAQDSDQFANLRAEAYWRLRQLLEDGRISLPDDRKLREELLAVKWSPNSRGQVAIEAKDDLKARLGRSPDRLDAVTMAFHPKATSTGGMTAEDMITHW